jgi:hypothetical protein
MPFVWVGGATAAAGLVGSALQSSAVGSAQDSANAASAAAREQARADLQPWTQTGGLANTQSANLLGLNGQEAADAAFGTYQKSPGYQFQLNEGLRAVDAGASAKGILRSGATLKAEQAYGAGLADSDFGQYYNRLFQMSGVGETAAAGQGAFSAQAGKDIAQTNASAGNAQASIYGNTTAGLSNAANTYANNSLYQQRLGGNVDTTSPFAV